MKTAPRLEFLVVLACILLSSLTAQAQNPFLASLASGRVSIQINHYGDNLASAGLSETAIRERLLARLSGSGITFTTNAFQQIVVTVSTTSPYAYPLAYFVMLTITQAVQVPYITGPDQWAQATVWSAPVSYGTTDPGPPLRSAIIQSLDEQVAALVTAHKAANP